MVGEVVVIVTFEEVAVSAAGMDEALVVRVWVCGFGILSLSDVSTGMPTRNLS